MLPLVHVHPQDLEGPVSLGGQGHPKQQTKLLNTLPNVCLTHLKV